MTDEQAYWWRVRRASVTGGEMGTFLRHGIRQKGLSHVFGDVSDVFMMDQELWVTHEVGNELMARGWPREQWVPSHVDVVVDVPWRDWFAKQKIDDMPPNYDPMYYARSKRKYPHRRVSISAFALKPSKMIEIVVLPGGPCLTDLVLLKCATAAFGIDSAMGEPVYGERRERYASDKPQLFVTSIAKALLEGRLDDPGSLLWKDAGTLRS